MESFESRGGEVRRQGREIYSLLDNLYVSLPISSGFMHSVVTVVEGGSVEEWLEGFTVITPVSLIVAEAMNKFRVIRCLGRRVGLKNFFVGGVLGSQLVLGACGVKFLEGGDDLAVVGSVLVSGSLGGLGVVALNRWGKAAHI